MSDDLKNKMNQLLDGCIKLRLMAFLPDEFLAWVANMEAANPTPENFAKLEKFHGEIADYLQKRADAYRPAPSQQAKPEIQHFAVQNTLIN